MKRPRRKLTSQFKAMVALAALKGDKTLSELASQYDVHPNQIVTWKKQLLEHAVDVFSGDTGRAVQEAELKDLHAKIGQLTMERDFLSQGARSRGKAGRKAMITPEADLSVSRQCGLLDLGRSLVYYQPKPVPESDLALMRRLDELHLTHVHAGSRMLCGLLRREGHRINRKKVRRLMAQMGLYALYPKKRRTSTPDTGHKVYPYLLNGLTIDRPNQVWCADITYIPLAKGFGYLVAVMDWFSRKVLSWRLSNTLDHLFCVEALNEALAKHGVPEIFNTDQGSQFTSEAFTKCLKDAGCKISMDGKGRWIDNRFIERLWRSLKHEDVYLNVYETMREAEKGIGKYLTFYNEQRPHQGLKHRTPDQVYQQNRQDQAA
ncbi:MAG: IS3 family transposase [bacterium]